MDTQKEQKMDMYFDKIAMYSNYIACLSRVIQEFIDNGCGNLQSRDIANLTGILNSYSSLLYLKICEIKHAWEFDE